MILNMMTRILKVSGKYKKQIQIAFIFSVLNAVLAKMPILYAMIIISKLYYGTMTSLHAIYVGIVMVITIILQMIFQHASDRLQSGAGYLLFSDKRIESVLIYVIKPTAPMSATSTPSYSSCATFMVLLA